MEAEPETPHILGTESKKEETESIKSNLANPFTPAFKLKEPTLVIDDTSDITSDCTNFIFYQHRAFSKIFFSRILLTNNILNKHYILSRKS